MRLRRESGGAAWDESKGMAGRVAAGAQGMDAWREERAGDGGREGWRERAVDAHPAAEDAFGVALGVARTGGDGVLLCGVDQRDAAAEDRLVHPV